MKHFPLKRVTTVKPCWITFGWFSKDVMLTNVFIQEDYKSIRDFSGLFWPMCSTVLHTATYTVETDRIQSTYSFDAAKLKSGLCIFFNYVRNCDQSAQLNNTCYDQHPTTFGRFLPFVLRQYCICNTLFYTSINDTHDSFKPIPALTFHIVWLPSTQFTQSLKSLKENHG